MKIVLWICIPLFAVSAAIVTWWHYRSRRRSAFEETDGLQLAAALPVEALKSGSIFSTPILSSRETYRLQLEAGKEQYQLLQTDFMHMKDDYAELLDGSGIRTKEATDQVSNEIQKKFKQYELKIAQLQQALDFLQSNAGTEENIREAQLILQKKDEEIKRLQLISEQLHREIGLLRQQNDSGNAEIQKLNQQVKELQESARRAAAEARELQMSFKEQSADKATHHYEEHNRLAEEIKQLKEVCRKLEEENRTLQLAKQDSRQDQDHEHEKRIAQLQGILIKTEQELLEYRNKLADAGSMGQIAEERKLQVEFLQNQLDQRIRANHQFELSSQETSSQLLQVQQELSDYKQQYDSWRQEAENLKEVNQSLRLQAEANISIQSQLEELLKEKQQQINSFEQAGQQHQDLMRELQQELLRNNTIISNLENQLSASRQEVLDLDNSLQQRQQLLVRLHQELRESLDLPVAEQE